MQVKNALDVNIYLPHIRPMKKLNEYLEGRKAKALAQKCGISQSFMCELRKGTRKPSFATMRAIQDATDGAVSFADWADDV